MAELEAGAKGVDRPAGGSIQNVSGLSQGLAGHFWGEVRRRLLTESSPSEGVSMAMTSYLDDFNVDAETSTARLVLAPDRFKSFWQTGRSGLAADYASGGQPQTATSMERDMVMAAIASEIGGT